MRIDNADGGEVEACGNATRCVGWLLMRESGRDSAAILTQARAARKLTRAGDPAPMPHARCRRRSEGTESR